MVRKGSPVRVRQRALRKGLELGAFRDPVVGWRLRALWLRGPLLGRVRQVSGLAASGFDGGFDAPLPRLAVAEEHQVDLAVDRFERVQ